MHYTIYTTNDDVATEVQTNFYFSKYYTMITTKSKINNNTSSSSRNSSRKKNKILVLYYTTTKELRNTLLFFSCCCTYIMAQPCFISFSFHSSRSRFIRRCRRLCSRCYKTPSVCTLCSDRRRLGNNGRCNPRFACPSPEQLSPHSRTI